MRILLLNMILISKLIFKFIILLVIRKLYFFLEFVLIYNDYYLLVKY
jgi:hypothetical protein